MNQCFLQYSRRGRILRSTKPIMHPSSLAARRNDAGFSQIGKVAGDFRLADAQDVYKIADADFPVGDQIEQAQARAIGQSAKEKVERQWTLRASHEKIIYVLTDICNQAYRAHIRIGVYI